MNDLIKLISAEEEKYKNRHSLSSRELHCAKSTLLLFVAVKFEEKEATDTSVICIGSLNSNTGENTE